MAGYRAAKQEDISVLAPTMRKADRIELFCSHGMTPDEALEYSWYVSKECNSIYDDEDIVMGMFGWSLDDEGSCIPWLLASDELKNHSVQFFKESREWIKDLMDRFEHGYNYTHAANTQSLRWLKMSGIKNFERVDNWGYYPSPFIKFSWITEKEKKHV